MVDSVSSSKDAQKTRNEQLRRAFQQLYKTVVESVNADSIVDYLFSSQIIGSDDNSRLNGLTGREKARHTLSLLHRCNNPKAFVILREALDQESAYMWITKQVDEFCAEFDVCPVNDPAKEPGGLAKSGVKEDASPKPKPKPKPSSTYVIEDRPDGISCPVCYNVYLSESLLADRRPTICCQEVHTICVDCFCRLKSMKSEPTCPTCRLPLLESTKPMINRDLLTLIESYAKRMNEFDASDLTISTEPFAIGTFADIYDVKWQDKDFALKVLRPVNELNKQLKQLRQETHMTIGLYHPNIVRLFGTTKLKGHRLGIMMEKVDSGSLYNHIYTLERAQAIGIGLGIIEGLNYIHSRRAVHCDIKPQNILLSGPDMTPKISDLGVSKVIQAAMINSVIVNTPKYTAPELLKVGHQFGNTVDIYSLSVILFEMFSGKSAESGLGSTVWQIISAVIGGIRPTIPDTFSESLRVVIERGWHQDPTARAKLPEFVEALKSMFNPTKKVPPQKPQKSNLNTNVSMEQQSTLVANNSFPLPVLSLNWDAEFDVLNSQELRRAMVDDIQQKSNLKKIVNKSVLSVMRAIPRHLFIDKSRMMLASQQELINAAYLYRKPIAATANTNESSPEILGTQLSMTEIVQGQSVLLVGMKGGYVQSVVAQLVGINGSVVTVTSNTEAMSVCKERVNKYCPLKSIVEWVKVDDVQNQKNVASAMKQKGKLFHTVIYCGAVSEFPFELVEILHPIGSVSIMAPVNINKTNTLFQLYVRHGGNPEIKNITDFGVRFEEVK